MADQTLMWTVLPDGRDENGVLRVSAVVSPRLTPQAPDEQVLEAFPEFLDWPATLQAARFALSVGAQDFELDLQSKPDSGLWAKLFSKATPVAGFVYPDFSKANWRSYPVRNILGAVRRHYAQIAATGGGDHPTLLPWKSADPALKDMLSDLGTRTQVVNFGDRQIEFLLPGFDRFLNEENPVDPILNRTVFGRKSVYEIYVPGPVTSTRSGATPERISVENRTMPPDWYNPRPAGPGTPLVNRPDAVLMDQFASAEEYSLYQADRFYRRTRATEDEKKMRFPSYQDIPDRPNPPEFDFHRIVASFGDYGHVLRALGLVLDFTVNTRGAPAGLFSTAPGGSMGLMSLLVKWDNGRDDSGDSAPRTAWVHDKQRFTARPLDSTMERGTLRLRDADDGWGVTDKSGDSLFDVYQVDADGAALKTAGFTLSAQRLVAKHLNPARIDGAVTYTTGDDQPVAALRSRGFGISRHGRAAELAGASHAADFKNAELTSGNGSSITYFADDVTKGYRIDVWPEPPAHFEDPTPGPWHSLHAREGDYRLIEQAEPLDFPADEGYASGASTTSDDAKPDDHYVHESLFRWTGWSLAAPRPGRTIRSREIDGTQLQAEEPTDKLPEAEDGNNLAVEWRAEKGTLPKLRFGWSYRFRARLVDIANNSLRLDDGSFEADEQVTDPVGYWRFEPVDPPAMVGRRRLSEGESLERMVIRSNFDVTADAYLSTPDIAVAIGLPASADFDYAPINERHLVPPKSSQQQCETHGAFDRYFRGWEEIRNGYEIAAREDGTLYDEVPGAQVQLVTPTALADVAKTTGLPPDLPTPDNPVGERIVGGQYVIHGEERLQTPYLPDVAAAGVAIRAAPGHDLPGVTGDTILGDHCAITTLLDGGQSEPVLLVFFSKPWPDKDAFRIILQERRADITDLPCDEDFPDDGAPEWDEAARTLTFFLPKGRIARLRYSSFVDPDHLGTFGILRWAGEAPENQGRVWSRAALGAHWMITPWRNLTMVHATQAPVCQPELIKMSPQREIGSQSARISCRVVRLHGPSSGKFEIEADWHEWIDDPNADAPERVHRKGQLGEILLSENHANTFVLSTAVNNQMHDINRPRARGDVHEIGDAKFKLIRYRVRASTRFREYLPQAIYDQPDLVTRLGPIAEGPAVVSGAEDDPGAPVLRDPAGETANTIVPASAPPDDPRILYVVPTFRWHSTDVPGGTDTTRYGNGLRVWLDRPWFSSGDGELLGVIIQGEAAPFTQIPEDRQALVTQWGADPLWASGAPRDRTRISDFPAAVADESVRLLEQPDASSVTVIGHRVHWDGARGLWYCDIALNPGAAYMPFVRLALVRYQPNALPTAGISKVALAEFSQILPRRRARLTAVDGSVQLSLRGPAPQAGPVSFDADVPWVSRSPVTGVPYYPPEDRDTGRNRFELVLQTRPQGIDSDLSWTDFRILASAIVGGGSGSLTIRPGRAGGIFDEAAISAETERVISTRAGRDVRLSATAARTLTAAQVATPLIEPVLWSATADLPDTGGLPARLMVREFERYYADRFVRDGSILRRVVEERLVYASTVDL
ncbi:hypothetical protein [uncultured Tateyamaria sp.]|uniref:hypothetical protein n=1 Tax=uncultured Tateyamaria sp. TaxID=455651 RepID=UPI002614F540|nr:hypothetical protein [uncultured Tateyamaria sp.]